MGTEAKHWGFLKSSERFIPTLGVLSLSLFLKSSTQIANAMRTSTWRLTMGCGSRNRAEKSIAYHLCMGATSTVLVAGSTDVMLSMLGARDFGRKACKWRWMEA
jgi:hypothetical protein